MAETHVLLFYFNQDNNHTKVYMESAVRFKYQDKLNTRLTDLYVPLLE